MILIGKRGHTYRLERQPFAQGGEGEIYRDMVYSDIVIKIYKQNVDVSGREQKLLVMLDNPPNEDQLKQIAWPIDVVYTQGGQFAGFVMQNLEISEELNVFYEYGPTAKYPDLPWSSKLVIARNLCAVVDSIHAANHVIGDFNPKNISVNPNTGRVTMLDTDSYHIGEGKHRCIVGMPDYLPPEVQKKMKGNGLAEARLPTFTKESDNFALAVHIFQLLMNGTHPFTCALLPKYESLGASMPSDNILKNHTPFFRSIHGRIPPKFAPSIKILPSSTRKLFRRTFLKGHANPKSRVKAADWYKELGRLESSLVHCSRFNHHEFPKSFKKCPWCVADMRFRDTRQKHTKVVKEGAKKRHEQKVEKAIQEIEKVYGPRKKRRSFLGRLFGSGETFEVIKYVGLIALAIGATFLLIWFL